MFFGRAEGLFAGGPGGAAAPLGNTKKRCLIYPLNCIPRREKEEGTAGIAMVVDMKVDIFEYNITKPRLQKLNTVEEII